MRPEELLLQDILHATVAIEQFIAGLDFEEFDASLLTRHAVSHDLAIIGEAAAKLPADFRIRHGSIPWRQIIGLRHVVVHGYFGLNWERVWATASVSVPELRDQIKAILAAEFPEEVS
jgi:uncharacterized protein with HEPN domain